MDTLMNDPTRDDQYLPSSASPPEASPSDGEYVIPTVVEEPRLRAAPLPPRLPRRRRVFLPVLLFVATCLSTLLAGGRYHWADGVVRFDWHEGLIYAFSLMTILIFHEAGHFFQARRYGVPASFPYFLPMPFSPLGTLGAVIGMDARIGNRKALFDIGITGPLAGLVPTIACCVIGLHLSTSRATLPDPAEHVLGTSVLFGFLAQTMVEPSPDGVLIDLHPMALAGWVGLLVTALNLLPIGQLDGGHILYGLLRTKANYVATLLLMAAVMASLFFWFWWWWLMLLLLMFIGPNHPPTADDRVPIGAARHVLGWLALAFVPLGLPPIPLLQ